VKNLTGVTFSLISYFLFEHKDTIFQQESLKGSPKKKYIDMFCVFLLFFSRKRGDISKKFVTLRAEL